MRDLKVVQCSSLRGEVMLGSTRLVNRARQVGVRRMGGWIRTHVRTEENAGLREASYKTWEFDTTSVPRLLVYMFIPGTLFFFMAKEEMVSSDASFGFPKQSYFSSKPSLTSISLRLYV